jgi:hypothetical protein
MLTASGGFSCLLISVQNGHMKVVTELLDAEWRELVMLTADGGASCLFISAHYGHVEVVKALLEEKD